MKKCSCGKASETEPEMPKRFRVLFLRNDKNCSVEIVETDQLSFEALLHRIECGESVFISQNITRKRHKQILTEEKKENELENQSPIYVVHV